MYILILAFIKAEGSITMSEVIVIATMLTRA